jgi:hypothetical protein
MFGQNFDHLFRPGRFGKDGAAVSAAYRDEVGTLAPVAVRAQTDVFVRKRH